MSPTKLFNRLLIILLLVPLASCIKSEDFDFDKLKEIEWNPTLAVPLVSSDLSIMDMIKQTGDSSNFTVDGQGFVTLVYKDRLYSINPMEKFTIPSTTFSFSHTFSAAEANLIAAGTPFSLPFTQEIKLTPADSIRIDSLIYTKGDFTVTITGNVTNNGSIALGIPNAKKNGVALNTTITPLTNGVNSVDLSGYKFDLTKVAGKPSTFLLSATITIAQAPANTLSGKTITFNFAQHTDNIKSVSGYLGRFYLVDDKKTININLFNNAFKIGKFNLVNPYFVFTFHNSIGLPLNLRFSQLTGESSEDGSTISLVGNPGIPNPITIQTPLYSDINPAVSTIRIDNVGTGGAISNLLNVLKPGSIIYNFYSLTNPDGIAPGGIPATNFLRDNSKLDIDVEFGLPLHGSVENFAIQDTFDFQFEDIEEVESMLIRTYIENEFPLEAKMQVIFTDGNFVRLDSLVTSTVPSEQIIIPAGEVNLTTGVLTQAKTKTSNFLYPKARITKITGAQKILVKGILNTTGASTNTNIKIYNNYKMKVKIAAQAEIKQKI